jgi:Tol biopolymer transport system component
VVALLLAGCSDPTRPETVEVPPFAFVSDVEGSQAIYRYDAGVVARLSAAGSDDREPHSAAGRIVFTSRRDGNAEIYSADLALSNQLRLTTSSATDDAPALDPSGTTVAFVSSRSGSPRIWLMDASGANPRPLTTGSASFVPEGSPAWSPDGQRITFTSTRTNASQVFTVPSAGGDAIQVSHEATGAFTPAWSGDGKSILYVVPGGPRIVRVPTAGGDGIAFATDDRGISEPACGDRVCLAVLGSLDGDGDLVALSPSGRTRLTLLARSVDDRQPAVLIP